MWYDNLGLDTILFAFVVWLIVFFFIKMMFNNRRLFGLFLSYLVIVILTLLLKLLNIAYGDQIFMWSAIIGFAVVMIIGAPDIRESIDFLSLSGGLSVKTTMGSEKTKDCILDAAEELSKTRTGALITIEKHNTLDEFAEKAITLDSEVSKEILLNIFIPNSPLHDGAVIIRGDRILCAGAYFTLSDNENFNKTSTGSRHRAGLGISEKSDSLTVIVSEETGNISIAIEGIMLKINDKEKLNEYLTTFMK